LCSSEKDVHFCPGAGGGTEWNSPAYDPRTNLIFVGDVDWCVTVRLQTKEELQATAAGQPWFGNRMLNPFDIAGKFSRADGYWAGWVHAVDADTGQWKWRLKSDYPIVAAVTPTAGGLVFFGDVGETSMRSTPRRANACGARSWAARSPAASSLFR
jgi:alcohol dehydrogenase (cytochrome c)